MQIRKPEPLAKSRQIFEFVVRRFDLPGEIRDGGLIKIGVRGRVVGDEVTFRRKKFEPLESIGLARRRIAEKDEGTGLGLFESLGQFARALHPVHQRTGSAGTVVERERHFFGPGWGSRKSWRDHQEEGGEKKCLHANRLTR